MKLLTSAALAGLVFAAAASAQDYSQSPNFGTINLASGFTPDPYVIDVRAGGSINVAQEINNCSGYISDAPDVRVNYNAGSLPLIFSVASNADTTLVINAADGRWYCNDDGGEGTNPSIRFANPQAGQYDIWVGTYSNSGLASAGLYISELTSQ